ncbi:NAD(P)/FAD-dependent oxidoreductase [Persicitalea jodogahamensis]|uniref:FAD-dependent oxidoreductase n=1 Tax=Persicitalea jodogahamensis TaxID=402147 RepID=A0A8J3D7Z8_9BACT|nr:NAD(P)/FAD-dependent oxidoreductase [Persicitalea jodogahamensis]GHB65114.1 FAD-dependent oxidoreductase [Persicitalea jodogahamensis]
MTMTYPVVIIGGGLAGLVSSIELARLGIKTLLIERKAYPHHKVCGEYVSNEVRPYLENLGLNLDSLGAAHIANFRFTSPKGSILDTSLDMGGFGISRYTLDNALYELSLESGVDFQLNTIVQDVKWADDHFDIETSDSVQIEAEIVIGAFGKRTRLDKQMNRDFMNKESPYVGVKYHIKGNFAKDLISLHNFRNGYCGMSAIEDDKYCLCYLTERSNLKESGSIPDMERHILSRNPHLKHIFDSAEFLYDKPEVINEVSFASKNAVENHILMAGDSAGLITPLCGNGMAMAIRAGSMVARETTRYFLEHRSRKLLETTYQHAWQKEFALRLKIGRTVQNLFGREVLSEMALGFFKITPPILRMVIKGTHGEVFTTGSGRQAMKE